MSLFSKMNQFLLISLAFFGTSIRENSTQHMFILNLIQTLFYCAAKFASQSYRTWDWLSGTDKRYDILILYYVIRFLLAFFLFYSILWIFIYFLFLLFFSLFYCSLLLYDILYHLMYCFFLSYHIVLYEFYRCIFITLSLFYYFLTKRAHLYFYFFIASMVMRGLKNCDL